MSDETAPKQPETDSSTNSETDAKTPAPAKAPEPTNTISFDDFIKVELRVGTVIEAGDHPNADKLIVLKVDLGSETRQILAGLKGFYTPEQLMGKQVTVVTNLAPRMMRGLESQGMILAASSADKSKVIIMSPNQEIEPGASIG